jgi:hypothetical protein
MITTSSAFPLAPTALFTNLLEGVFSEVPLSRVLGSPHISGPTL